MAWFCIEMHCYENSPYADQLIKHTAQLRITKYNKVHVDDEETHTAAEMHFQFPHQQV